MDERTNHINAGTVMPLEVEDCKDQPIDKIRMAKHDKVPRENETNLVATSELIANKNFAPLMERDETVTLNARCYENYAFREDAPTSVSANSGASLSDINIQITNDGGETLDDSVRVSNKKAAQKKGLSKKNFLHQEKTPSDCFILNSLPDFKDNSPATNNNDSAVHSDLIPDEVSPIHSEPQSPPSSYSPRSLARAARTFITSRFRSSSDSSTESGAERSRDWLFMSVITLVVSALDKLFDVLFLLTLLAEEEWVFLGVGLTFTVASTITTSLFAAQSFWLQSSQISTWSSTWVKEIPHKKTVFLHEKFSKPINRRILPESSRFAEPEVVYDTHDGGDSTSSSSNDSSSNSSISTNTVVLGTENLTNLWQENKINDGNNNTQGKFNQQIDNINKSPNKTNVLDLHVRSDGEETSMAGCTGCAGVAGSHPLRRESESVSSQSPKVSRLNEDSQEAFRKTEDINEATDSSGRSTPADAADCGAEQPTKQHFQPWVRFFVIAMFCTGLLPESVLIIHLVLYAKAGPKRRTISKMLRDTWFVQTLKLSEALLESIPQIHLKMFYYLTRYREDDLSGILDDDIDWLTSQSAGLLVNAASICIGLVAILHVHIKFKILAFIFLFINLATRIAVCASLDFVTVPGVYFIPFGVALIVSAAAMVVITVLKCGQFRPGSRKLEKYIGIPVMRTFCKPPVDVPGVAVSTVFVAASIVCAHYIGDGSLNLMAVVVVCGAFIGQVVPGLAWHATGISREHQENKRR